MFSAAFLFGVAAGFSPPTVAAGGLKAAATLSQQLTTAAEELLKIEKKIAGSRDGLDAFLFEDVLTLLDEAIEVDPQNLHAHARAGEVLLLKSNQGDGTFDICRLLDARDEADYVLSHGGGASPDGAIARGLLRAIDAIPPDAIPDSPSSCDEGQERRHGTKTRSS